MVLRPGAVGCNGAVDVLRRRSSLAWAEINSRIERKRAARVSFTVGSLTVLLLLHFAVEAAGVCAALGRAVRALSSALSSQTRGRHNREAFGSSGCAACAALRCSAGNRAHRSLQALSHNSAGARLEDCDTTRPDRRVLGGIFCLRAQLCGIADSNVVAACHLAGVRAESRWSGD